MGQPNQRYGTRREDEVNDYEAFIGKFKPSKRTTDDCYTPPEIYQAVKDYVYKEYEHVIQGLDVVRPFHPGRDYQAVDYTNRFVLDNPPFSKLAKIVEFYLTRGVKFFLFAPLLTMFSSRIVRDNPEVCAIIQQQSIRYENGAVVSTGFLTNMDEQYRIRVSKCLSDAIYQAQVGRVKPKYKRVVWPRELWSTSRLQKFCGVGDFDFTREQVLAEGVGVVECDNSGGRDGRVFGRGFLLAPGVCDMLEQVEREGWLDGKHIKLGDKGRAWLYSRAVDAGYSETRARRMYLEEDEDARGV